MNRRNLQQLLSESLAPPALSDADIEQLDSDFAATIDDATMTRIAVQAHKLIDESSRHAINDRLTGKPSVVTLQTSGGRQITPRNRTPRGAVAALTVSVMSLLAVLFWTSQASVRYDLAASQVRAERLQNLQSIQRQWMTASLQAGQAASGIPTSKPQRVAVGDVIETSERQRRRVHLPDGSVLYVNESCRVKVVTDRRIAVTRGEVFVEVVPQFDDDHVKELFEVVTPTRTVTALGTKFAVDASAANTEVLVTQGKVRVTGVDDVVESGQRVAINRQSGRGKLSANAMRASEHLSWTRDLMDAAAGALVPVSEYAGGAIITVDPDGQETKLSLRKYHVDVHIEDGFARTTIDQTYFNHTHSRLEGTFHFPLPPDASLSRLAMYVNGKLMEGGMAERQHARNTFEKIVHKMKDPALLEWVDGTTFKMRVFPLEARQEKRIVLSYTQRLNNAYGKISYRFPAGHTMDVVGKWSTSVRVNDGLDQAWHSPSHELSADTVGDDVLLTATETNSRMDRDLVVEIDRPQHTQVTTQWSRTVHEDQQYLMLRYRPEFAKKMKRESRHWVFLFESSADRNPLLARTQIEIIRTLLNNAEHTDTFNIVMANTEPTVFSQQSLQCSAQNIVNAIATLEHTHLVGAMDLEQALTKCVELSESPFETLIVHTGSAIPVLGEQDQSALLSLLPEDAGYVGVGVGKRWSRPLMKAAASRSGGYFTQINPDEDLAWRAFELSSLLNTPRLLDVNVTSKGKGEKPSEWLNFAGTIVDGEQICAVTQLNADQPLPRSVLVSGVLNGKPWKRTLAVKTVADDAEHLPRSWARLEIDRLIEAGAAEHQQDIVRLSKAMYVMSPFTSLLVLENEEMYTQHNIDRGRKDHWALYPCPNEIAVVREPVQSPSTAVATSEAAKQKSDPASNLRFLQQPRLMSWPAPVAGRRAGAVSQSDLWVSGLDARDLRRRDFLMPQADVFYSMNDLTRSYDDLIQFPLDNGGDGIAESLWMDFSVATGEAQNGQVRALPNFASSPPGYFRGGSRDNSLSGLQRPVNRQFQLVPEGLAGVDKWAWFADIDRSAVGQNVERFAWNVYRTHGTDADLGWREFPVDWDNDWQLNGNDSNADGLGRVRRIVVGEGRADFGEFSASRELKSLTEKMGEDALVNRYDDLMRQRRFAEAELVAGVHRDRNPDSPQGIIMHEKAKLQRQIAKIEDLKDRKADNALRMFNGVDESFAGSVDDYVFPDATLWSELGSRRRFRYSFSSGSERSEWKVEKALRETTSLHFRNVPLEDVVRHVATQNAINIVVSGSARDSLNTLVYIDVDGISLRSALRLLLDQAGNLTYQVENEVVKITTRAERNSQILEPSFGKDPHYFGDLMTHAPGLNTSPADVLALRDEKQAAGDCDPAARGLVERARSLGWERVTLPAADEQDSFTVLCDGAGRHAYSRTVSEGLREEILCDGQTLKHVYADIGLASERTFSRFHRRTIESLVPWLVPSVDELSNGADLVTINEHTVAIRPKRPADVPAAVYETRLVFENNGRLGERHIVELATDRVALKTAFDSDGTVRLLDHDDKELIAVAFQRESVAEDEQPQLTVDETQLVLLPMPIHSVDSLLQKTSPDTAEDKPDTETAADDSADQPLSLILAYIAEGKGQLAAKLMQDTFFSKGDRRDGLYVLLSRFPNSLIWAEDVPDTDGRKRQVDLRPSPEGSPLRQFLCHYLSWQKNPDTPLVFDIEGSGQGFVQRMAAVRNLYNRWNSQAATKDRTQSQIAAELKTALEFVAGCQSEAIGWTLLSVIRQQIEHAELHGLVADAVEPFEHHPLLGRLARQERVRALFAANAHSAARQLYSKRLKADVRGGRVPKITHDIREQFIANDGEQAWKKLVDQCGAILIKARRPRTAFQFSVQLQRLGDDAAAARLLDQVLADVSVDSRPDVVALAVQQLRLLNDGRADGLLDSLSELPTLQKDPKFWRYASQVADDLGRRQVALDRLERAIDLEFADPPDVINAEQLRANYTGLMVRYEAVIDASATLETAVPEDLFARIVRAADQWRSLEDDPTTCCHTTARLLHKLDRQRLAWGYLTTPLAEHSGESTPWRSLAKALTQLQRIELADMAWSKAFEFEQTNPEILLEHAMMLNANDRADRSRPLLQKIIDSDWQPRFARVQQQAQALLP